MMCAYQEAEDLLAGIDELDAAGLGAALTQYGVRPPHRANFPLWQYVCACSCPSMNSAASSQS